jgi:hypothetical protein
MGRSWAWDWGAAARLASRVAQVGSNATVVDVDDVELLVDDDVDDEVDELVELVELVVAPGTAHPSDWSIGTRSGRAATLVW